MIELKTAKYKGVEFLWDSSETKGGNRNIGFTFPGSNAGSVQRQGRVPRKFVITAVIPHEDYYNKRDQLIRVLEDGKKGVLVHPTWGNVDNVAAGEYTLTERQSELGRATIEVNLSVDDAKGIPVSSGALAAQVQQESDALNSQGSGDFAGGFEVTATFPGNITDAIDAGATVAASFSDSADLAAANPSKAAAYQAKLKAFANNIGTFVTDSVAYADGIMDMFEATALLYEDERQTLDAMISMFVYGDFDPEIVESTVGRIQRKKNRDILRALIKLAALSYAYLSAVESEYTTSEDLESVRNLLEEQYVDLRDNQLLSNEAIEQLDRLRVQAEKTLDNVGVNTRSIITVNIQNPRPLSVIIYDYYGSTELFDDIAALNNIKQNAFVDGDLRILTS